MWTNKVNWGEFVETGWKYGKPSNFNIIRQAAEREADIWLAMSGDFLAEILYVYNYEIPEYQGIAVCENDFKYYCCPRERVWI